MAGDRKRKGSSKAKKQMIYRLEGRLENNRTRRAKVQRTAFIKSLRKAGLKDAGEALLNLFTSCKVCRKGEKVLVKTYAPVVAISDVLEMGGYCVRCGFKEAVKNA